MAALDDGKRKMIVNEIETWRRSKLLPEQYCDFLQNLYLDDLSERPKSAIGAAVYKMGQASWKQWISFSGMFALICLVLLHFSSFPAALQIGIIALATAAFVAGGAILREKAPARAMMLLGAGMLFLLGSGMALLQLRHWTEGAGPIALLVICAAVWIGCGIALRFPLLHGCGWMAAIVLYARLLARHVPEPHWFEVQVFWIPPAFLFGWLSWYWHVRYKPVSAVFFTIALLLWFMPEAYSALFKVEEAWIELELIVKIALAGFGMYRLRRKWMEWVA